MRLWEIGFRPIGTLARVESWRSGGGADTPVELLNVPENVIIQDGRLEVSEVSFSSNQDVRAGKADQRQFICHDLLDAVIKPLAFRILQRRHLPLHQAVDLRF